MKDSFEIPAGLVTYFQCHKFFRHFLVLSCAGASLFPSSLTNEMKCSKTRKEKTEITTPEGATATLVLIAEQKKSPDTWRSYKRDKRKQSPLKWRNRNLI